LSARRPLAVFLAVSLALPLLAILIARLVTLQVPVAEVVTPDFEFGPLEPGSVTAQGLGDLGVTASGIAVPVIVREGGESGVGVRFRLLGGDGALIHEQLLDLAPARLAEDRSDKATIERTAPAAPWHTIRYRFPPLETPVHGAILEIEAADLGDARVFLGATKEDTLPAGRLSYQGAELYADQDLRVEPLRTVTVWRVLAELRHNGPTGFAAALVLAVTATLLVATASTRLIPGPLSNRPTTSI
jgi:hypothetical protein